MAQEISNTQVGNNRLETMTGDKRKGKKLPGAGFWFLFCLLFIAGCILFIWIFGGLIKSGADSIKKQPGALTEVSRPGATEKLSPPIDAQKTDSEATREPADSSPGKVMDEEPLTAAGLIKKPKTIGGTDIYRDENGVWRNLNRDDAPRKSASGKAAQTSGGSAASNVTRPKLPDLSGGGQPQKNGGGQGDMSAIMSLLSGLTGGGQPQKNGGGQGDMSAIMSLLPGLAGRAGQTGGISSHNDNGPARKDERRIEELRTKAINNQVRPQGRIQSFEGFERFDPENADNIKSQWEYFNDPR